MPPRRYKCCIGNERRRTEKEVQWPDVRYNGAYLGSPYSSATHRRSPPCPHWVFGGKPMSRTIRATSPRRLLVALLTLLLALPLTLALASPASADGTFFFSGRLHAGEEFCLGPAFTDDPATARAVQLFHDGNIA